MRKKENKASWKFISMREKIKVKKKFFKIIFNQIYMAEEKKSK